MCRERNGDQRDGEGFSLFFLIGKHMISFTHSLQSSIKLDYFFLWNFKQKVGCPSFLFGCSSLVWVWWEAIRMEVCWLNSSAWGLRPLVIFTPFSKPEEGISHLLLTGFMSLVFMALTAEHAFLFLGPLRSDRLSHDFWDTDGSHSEELARRFLWPIKGSWPDGTQDVLYLFKFT